MEDEIANFADEFWAAGKLDGYVIYKDGAFVDWADLAQGDVIYIMGLNDSDDLDTVALLYVIGVQTGDYDKYDAGTETDTEGYVRIDDVKYYAQWEDGDTSFFTFGLGGDWKWWDGWNPDDFFGDVSFAKAYYFKDFLYVNSEGAAVDGYGIVTGYDYDKYKTVNAISEITIKAYDGTEETFPVDLCDEGVKLGKDLWKGEDDYLTGALVEYKLNDDGQIYFDDNEWSFNVRGAGEAVPTFEDYDNAWRDLVSAPIYNYVHVEVDDEEGDESIGIEGDWYDVPEDVEIFSVWFDKDDELQAETMDREALLADDFVCGNIAIFYGDDSEIETLYIFDYDTFSQNYGVVTSVKRSQSSDGYRYVWINGVEYAFDEDYELFVGIADEGGEPASFDMLDLPGAFVEFYLNKNGEINSIIVMAYIDGDGVLQWWRHGFGYDAEGGEFHFEVAGDVQFLSKKELTNDFHEGNKTWKLHSTAKGLDMTDGGDTFDKVTEIQAEDYALVVVGEKGKVYYVLRYYNADDNKGTQNDEFFPEIPEP